MIAPRRRDGWLAVGAWVLAGCPYTPPVVPDPPDPTRLEVDAGADLEVQIGVELTFQGAGSEGTRGAWDFGDGGFAEGFAVRHVYERPGNYVATLSVTDDAGQRRTDTTRVTVFLPPADPLPVASTSITIDPTRGEAWVTVPEANALAVISLSSPQPPAPSRAAVFVPVCGQPRTVAFQVIDGVGMVGVACEETDEVVVLDATTRGVLVRYPLFTGARPFGIVGRDGTWWATGQGRGEVMALFDRQQDRRTIGEDPRAIALGAGDHWFASRLRSDRFGGTVWTPEAPIALAPDPGPDSDTLNRGVPTVLHALALSPDGGTLFVGGHVANTERGLFVDDDPLTPGTTVRATVRVVDVATGAERLDRRKVFDNVGQVSALALSPRGTWLWVAHPGTGTIHLLDAFTLETKGAILGAGAAIDGLAVTPDGSTLLAHAWLDRQVKAWDITDPVRPTPAWTAPTVEFEPLDGDVLAGKRLFHDAGPRLARDGYVSCATCHPDGRDDGMVWDFTQRGEGLRNTITLEGRGGTAMGPLHWTGNFDEVQDFEGDIRLSQGGAGLLDDVHWATTADPLGAPKAGLSGELDALAAYVASLTRTPPSPWLTAPEEGLQLFYEKGCDTCHVPETGFTDSNLLDPVRHDVGTAGEGSGGRLGGPLDGFDTPTLLGVWATAPYLHDGSAPTLAAAIGAHELDVTITNTQLVAIAAWLRTL